MRALSVYLTLIFLFGAASCSSDAASSASDLPTKHWRLAAEPLAVIGDEDSGSDVLSGSVSALLLSDRRVAVADGGSRKIRIFSADGLLQRSFGGDGNGPGEFRRLTAMRHGPGGGLCAWDSLLSRVTCFSAAGAIQTTMEVDRSEVQQVLPAFVGVFDDTTVVLRDWPPTQQMHDDPEGERRDSVNYLRFDAAGAPKGTLVRVPGEETYFLNGEVWSNEPILFGRGVVDALDGDRLLVAVNDSLDLHIYDASGATLRQVQRATPLAPVTKEMLASVKARNAHEDSVNQVQLAKNLPPDILRRFVRAHAEMASRKPHRETLPAFEDAHLDHAGRIWLGALHALDTEVREWKVLDANFRPLATLQLPAPAEILDVGRDRILLLLRDEMDAESVQLYSIEQGEP